MLQLYLELLSSCIVCLHDIHLLLYIGFQGVEFGANAHYEYSIEQLVAAKEEADVEVIAMCAHKGSLFLSSKGLTLFAFQVVSLMTQGWLHNQEERKNLSIC